VVIALIKGIVHSQQPRRPLRPKEAAARRLTTAA